MQETGITTHTENIDSNYMFILSRTSKPHGEGRFYFGVGFLIAPWAIKSIISYTLLSDRQVVLKLKILGCILNILTACTPHGGYDCEERREFPTSSRRPGQRRTSTPPLSHA
eukprot:723731-Pyramimonas_sp.AAC.1